MATFTKNKKSFCGMKTGMGNVCLSGRKIGDPNSRIEKGEQLSIHRHEIKQ